MRWRQILAHLWRALGETLTPNSALDRFAREEAAAAQLAEAERRAAARRQMRARVERMRRPELLWAVADIFHDTQQAERSAVHAQGAREPRQALASRPITRSKRPRDRQSP